MEAVLPGHVVVVDLVRRVGGRVEGLHRVRHGRESRGWPVTVDHRGCRSHRRSPSVPFRVVSPALRPVARACALAAALAATAGRPRPRRIRPAGPAPCRRRRARRSPTSATRCRSGIDSSAYIRRPRRPHRAASTSRSAPRDVRLDISGGRSVVEHLDGQEGGEEAARRLRRQGFHGCWVIALGTNDAANVDAGSRLRLQRADRPDDGDHRRRPGAVGRRQDAQGQPATTPARTCACSTRRCPRPTPATRRCRCSTGPTSPSTTGSQATGSTTRPAATPTSPALDPRPPLAEAFPADRLTGRPARQMPPAWRIVSIIRRMPLDFVRCIAS